MRFSLAEGDLIEFREYFKPGCIWSCLRGDPEALRFWKILRETDDGVLMHHGTGAVAILTMKKGRLNEVSLLQGRDAEEVIRREGFRMSAENRLKVKKHLRAGAVVKEVLGEAWPLAGQITHLFSTDLPGGVKLLYYRFSWGAILEITADENGRIRSRRCLEGGEALDVSLRSAGAVVN